MIKTNSRIVDFLEYENSENFGYAITTNEGDTLSITAEDYLNCSITGKSSEPKNPDIIGATIDEWYFYIPVEKENPQRELILVLETSKGPVKLSVYNYNSSTNDTILAKVSSFNYNSFDTVPTKVSWEYRI